jgi:hypothetical protein
MCAVHHPCKEFLSSASNRVRRTAGRVRKEARCTYNVMSVNAHDKHENNRGLSPDNCCDRARPFSVETEGSSEQRVSRVDSAWSTSRTR